MFSNDICRLCLGTKSKESFLLLFAITKAKMSKFKELTGIELHANGQLPKKICADCDDKLETFHFFKAQLIQKQQQLEEMLLEMTTETLQQNEGEENHFEVIIEEHLETDEEEIVEEDYYVSSDNSCGPFDENEDEIVEVISLPSVKHLRSTDNKSIINLINKIEEKNELILQVSTPPTVKRKVQSSSSKPKTSANQVAVPRKEDLKFEEPKPKIILQPTTSSTPTTLQSSEKHRVKRLPKPLEVPLTCCEQTFTMKLKFREHLKNYHPRPLQCSHCGKILRNRKTFLVHSKSHQNFADRRFKCSYENCEKAFNFKLHLNNHERTHSGERPFKCNQCPSAFKQSHQLTIHMRKHEKKNEKRSKSDRDLISKSELKTHNRSA